MAQTPASSTKIDESVRTVMSGILPASMSIATRHGLPCDYTAGHRPRYVAGNLSDPSLVRIILLMAEPGSSPASGEVGRDEATWLYDVTCDGLGNGGYRFRYDERAWEPYETKPREFLAMVWPNATYTEKMRQSVVTNAFWMQAWTSGGGIPRQAEVEFAPHLARFCRAFPRAIVVAAGEKSKRRCNMARIQAIEMEALTQPQANKPRAHATWRCAADKIQSILAARAQ